MNHSGDLDRVTAEAIEAKEPDEPSLLQPEDVLHFVVRARLEDAPLQLEPTTIGGNRVGLQYGDFRKYLGCQSPG
jgi:hypothetical protein